MKSLRVLISLLLVLALFSGCAQTGVVQKPKEPVNFYYCTRSEEHSQVDALILPEAREALGHTDDPQYLISLYLNGPLSYQYVSPFPHGVTLHAFSVNDGTADVTLSSQITQLTDFEATLAFACLTLTVKELTGTDRVTIRSQNGLINDNPSITLSPEQFAFPTN